MAYKMHSLIIVNDGERDVEETELSSRQLIRQLKETLTETVTPIERSPNWDDDVDFDDVNAVADAAAELSEQLTEKAGLDVYITSFEPEPIFVAITNYNAPDLTQEISVQAYTNEDALYEALRERLDLLEIEHSSTPDESLVNHFNQTVLIPTKGLLTVAELSRTDEQLYSNEK